MAASIRRTKIVATLGPASSSPEMIAKLIEAGVNVFRLNFSHGKQSEHAECIRRIRAASSDGCGCVGILQDLQGPKIRVGPMVDRKPILLEAGKRLRIVTSEVQGTPDLISTTYEPLPDDVRPGDMILLDDGRLQVRVVAKEGRAVVVEVVIGGLLGEHKGMNLPHTPLSAPCLTAKDISDLRFGVAQGVDYIGLSFVRQAQDILEVRRLCREAGRDLPVVAKIERIEAIERLEEIVDAADAIMVARGDLGVETGPAEVPILQKQILDTAGCKGKPDITATQMLETMVENPLPSRAEATDVANAVFDGTDAVMLSAETAVGEYPVETITAMNRICIEAEKEVETPNFNDYQSDEGILRVDEAIAKSAAYTALNLNVKAIAAMTQSGSTALWMSRISTHVPIYALTPEVETRRKVTLFRGVYPVNFKPSSHDRDQLLSEAQDELRRRGAVRNGDLILLTIGEPIGRSGGTNTMKIVRIGERKIT